MSVVGRGGANMTARHKRVMAGAVSGKQNVSIIYFLLSLVVMKGICE